MNRSRVLHSINGDSPEPVRSRGSVFQRQTNSRNHTGPAAVREDVAILVSTTLKRRGLDYHEDDLDHLKRVLIETFEGLSQMIFILEEFLPH